ncbi:MAG: choice-of-anchor D domain-containing protein [Bacteroidales bacterium]|nr:choice-of-anchor D domain-containing protein [Bacteroidales bacterium]
MKRFTILFLSFLFAAGIMADEWIGLKSEQPAPAKVILQESDISTSVIKLSIDGFYLHPVQTPNGEVFVPMLDETSPILQSGSPDLPKVTASVIIPDLAGMELEIISKSFTDFNNIEIAPSKGNLTRDIDPSTVPYVWGKVYQIDGFYPANPHGLRDPYIIRDYRGQTIIFYPFQYNPVTKVLRVFDEMTVRLHKISDNGFNPLIRENSLVKVDEQFDKIYSGHFLNYNSSKYTPVEEEGNMLIISYGSFMTDMQSFVDWKNTIGIPTEMVDVATIGNSAAIKTYIANYYTSNGLTFVLLVGDAAQVPSSYSSGDSDNNYSYIVGSDHYPDIFIGRFSAESNAHVQTQVQRTIEYEQTPYTGYDWYTKCIGIASSEGPGDDNEYDYQHVRNMQTDLMGYTYSYNYELFDGSQGGNDASGNPTTTLVANAINSGSSIVLYTGHGSTTAWSSSGFSSTNVNALTNNDKLPFIWAVACVNGNFVGTTCFAEAWLRATNGGEPSGAVATLMSTINQSWNPPMEGQDEMVDILVESYANNIKRTFGGLSMNGCMKMNDTYGSGGSEMTDTWTVFGDPSVVVRTAVPQNMTVTHSPVILLGSDQFTVNCNIEGALVCLTINNQIIGKAYVSGGSATVGFDQITSIETVKIAVTSYNYIPYIAEVEVIPASGPYVSFDNYQINDASGNNNGEADYNENITLDVTLENTGSSPAYDVTALISTADSYVSITDNYQTWGTIPDGSSSTQTNAFSISISNNIPDQHAVNFELEISGDDTDEIWTSNFNITVNAPNLEAGSITINDSGSGNGNGILDPGETANVVIGVSNTGASNSPSATGTLNCISTYITIIDGSDDLGVINAGEAASSSFTVEVDAGAPIGTTVNLNFNVVAGNYTDSKVFAETIGQIPVVIIDLDDTPVSGIAIQSCLTNLGIASDYYTTIPASLSQYSTAFVCLGIYSNNYVLNSTEGTTLANFLSAGGNLYMEGGDTWAYDTQTAVHSMFGLTGSSDGSGDLGSILGQTSTFTSGMTFGYSGENSYIDHIDPNGTAFSIFHNQSPDYSCAVAYDQGSYKTIGASFEFGGLTDGSAPSTKIALMQKIVDFFEIGLNPEPAFVLDPSTLDYGNVFVGESDIQQFTITNEGSAALNGNITTPLAFSVAEASKGDVKSGEVKNSISYNIAAYSSQDFDLTFTPTEVNCYNGNVTIISNDPEYLSVNLSVSGCGINPPEINANPTELAVTIPPDGNSNVLLSIENKGGSQLDFSATIAYNDKSRDVITVYPQNQNYWTGTCTSSSKTQTSLVKGQPTTEAGWMTFDVSSIPDGATINSITFNGYVNYTNWPYWNITPVTSDPLTASASVLYADITYENASGYYLFQSEVNGYTTGWKSHILGGTSSTDLQNALTQDRFTIGIFDRDGSSSYYIWFDGWNETNRPYLEIDYTYEPVASWLTLDGETVVSGSVDPSGSQAISVGFDATGLAEGVYTADILVSSNDPDHPLTTIPCTMTVSNGFVLNLEIMLEGPFNGTDMNTTLNSFGYIPDNQPYSLEPWNYNGTESVTGMPNSDVVDWVLVELRETSGDASSATPATMIARQAGFLLKDGTVVSIDGTTPMFFSVTVNHNLFTIVYHRNHLGVMSSDPVPYLADSYSWDFTIDADNAYGAAHAQNEISAGIFGLRAGDANGDMEIENCDKNDFWNPAMGNSGYYPGDFNLNGEVEENDAALYWEINAGKCSFIVR